MGLAATVVIVSRGGRSRRRGRGRPTGQPAGRRRYYTAKHLSGSIFGGPLAPGGGLGYKRRRACRLLCVIFLCLIFFVFLLSSFLALWPRPQGPSSPGHRDPASLLPPRGRHPSRRGRLRPNLRTSLRFFRTAMVP